MKALVVGGGIIGTSIALELATSFDEVTVVDRTESSREASWAAAGMLAPQAEATAPGPLFKLMLQSRALYPAWVSAIEASSGHTTGYLESGLLQVAFTEEETEALDAKATWQRALGLKARSLDGHGARALEPALSNDVKAGLFFADEHQVDPRQLLPAVQTVARSRHVSFRQAAVTRLITEAGRARGVEVEDDAPMYADVIIIAGGAWSSLIESLGLVPLDVNPVRGQMIELQWPYQLLTRTLKTTSGYIVPRADHRLTIGSTAEHVGYDKTVTQIGVGRLLEVAGQLVPALKGLTPTASWAGLRPNTRDGLPIISEGAMSGVVIATGHFRNGIVLAPITARLVGQIVRGEKPALDVTPFRASRFSS